MATTVRCVRCGRETEPFKMVGGYAYGPKCYFLTFGKEDKFSSISVAERDDRTIDWVSEVQDDARRNH